MQLRELDANLVVVFDALLIDASVTKAAARLGRSPSAVSHALANLREIFSDNLFVRAGQRLVPTARADELASTVHIIVSGMESLLRPTEPFDPVEQVRSFSMSCRDVCELTLLYHLRDTLKSKAPGIAVSWQSLDGERFVDDLRGGALQFVMLEACPNEAIGDLCWQMIGTERYVTLGRSGHPLAERKIKKSDYAGFPHIFVRPVSGAEDNVIAHLQEHDVVIEDQTLVSSCFSGLLLALRSDSLIMVPESIATSLASSLDLARIREPFPLIQVENYLVWHRSQDRDECHNWLRQEIIDVWTRSVGSPEERRAKKRDKAKAS